MWFTALQWNSRIKRPFFFFLSLRCRFFIFLLAHMCIFLCKAPKWSLKKKNSRFGSWDKIIELDVNYEPVPLRNCFLFNAFCFWIAGVGFFLFVCAKCGFVRSSISSVVSMTNMRRMKGGGGGGLWQFIFFFSLNFFFFQFFWRFEIFLPGVDVFESMAAKGLVILFLWLRK